MPVGEMSVYTSNPCPMCDGLGWVNEIKYMVYNKQQLCPGCLGSGWVKITNELDKSLDES